MARPTTQLCAKHPDQPQRFVGTRRSCPACNREKVERHRAQNKSVCAVHKTELVPIGDPGSRLHCQVCGVANSYRVQRQGRLKCA